MFFGYTISPAKDEGYFVFEAPSNERVLRILFSGSLDDCLAYVKESLLLHDSTKAKKPK